MEIIPLLLKEIEQEAAITRKMLNRVPDDKWDWKPHEKSMTMKQLTVHLAELPSWIQMGLATSELDFSKFDYKPTPVTNKDDLLALFEKSYDEGRNALSTAAEDALWGKWTMRNGDQVLAEMSKYEVIRHSIAQTIHHRAQLGVFLRLLNIPIPGSYGPSADEPSF
jgi:uncharacterized damage-inducible protein DinB